MCQAGTLVAGILCGANVTVVGGHAGDGVHTGLLVENGVHLIRGQTQLLHHKGDHRGVHTAGAGAHHKAVQRGKAHGGVYHFAVIHSSHGRAVAQVAGDQLQIFNGLAHLVCAAVRYIKVRSAVEAVTAHAVLLVPLIGYSIHISLRRHGAVECGIKYHHLGYIRTHNGLAGLIALDMAGVVQRRQRRQLAQVLHYRVVHQHAVGVNIAALHDAVAYGVNLFHRIDHLVLALAQNVLHFVKSVRMGRQLLVVLKLLSIHLDRHILLAAVDGHTDPLNDAFTQHGQIAHIHQLIF